MPPPPGAGVRERILAEVERDPAAAHARLAALDPRAAEAVHANDQRRLVRALELAEAGASLVPDDDRLWASTTRHPTVIVGLEVPPDELERRIVARTEAMFDAGCRARRCGQRSRQASRERRRRPSASTRSQRCPRTEARERIVIRTRRYAAYQRKWMRRIPGIVPVDGTRRVDEIATAIIDQAAAARGAA